LLPAGVECGGAAVDVGGRVANVLVDEWTGSDGAAETGGCHLGVGLSPSDAGVEETVLALVSHTIEAGTPRTQPLISWVTMKGAPRPADGDAYATAAPTRCPMT
jgi:hypothetical protein